MPSDPSASPRRLAAGGRRLAGPGRRLAGPGRRLAAGGRRLAGPGRRLPESRERGQAAVELVAVLPLLGVLAALGWQAVVAGHAAWAATAAARAAARAAAIGDDGTAVARRRLGPALAPGASVTIAAGGRVTVNVAIPRVLGALPLGHVTGASSFRPQDGS
jgi:hypothetical protein